jgi:hypothetical protein
MLHFYLVLFLVGCQHSPLSSELAQEGNCDAAFDKIPWEATQVKFVETSKQIAGTAASYTATGLGYLTDAFVFVGEGAYKTIVYCPYATVAFASAIAAHIRTPPLVYCGKETVKVSGSRFGQKIYSTINQRKTDLDKISEINRNAASCYARRGGEKNKHLAAEKLAPLANDDMFLKNLSIEERDRLTADYRVYSE